MTDDPIRPPRDTAADVMGPLSKLQARLAEVAKKAGLVMTSTAFIPSHRPDGSHVMQAVFVPSDEPPPPDDETKDTLEAIEEATRRSEQEERADKARKDLADLATETKPDPTPPSSGGRGELGPRNRGIGLDD